MLNKGARLPRRARSLLVSLSRRVLRWLARRFPIVVAFAPAPRLAPTRQVIPPLPPAALPNGERPLIVHAIRSMIVGGSQRLVCDVVRGLGPSWDQRILTNSVGPRLGFANFPVHVAPTGAALDRFFERRPALVHVHYWGRSHWLDEVMAALSRRWPGVPVVIGEESAAERWEHPAFVHRVFVSEFMRARYGVARESTSVIHPGIDTDEFRPAASPARDETVGLVYRLSPDKLAPDTIDVLIQIARARADARFVLVGSGPYLADYVARTEAAGVRARFDFAGLVPYHEVAARYDRFTLFLAPAHSEAFGIVVASALAKNIAVCGYRIGALAELLGSDETLADTPDELAAIAAALLADPERRARIAARGRERVIAKFSLPAMLDAYRALYASLAQNTRSESIDSEPLRASGT